MPVITISISEDAKRILDNLTSTGIPKSRIINKLLVTLGEEEIKRILFGGGENR